MNDEVTLISGGTSQSVAPDAPPYAGLEQSLNEFVTAVTEGNEPATSGRDNLKSLAMVFSTVEAAKKHRRVALKG